MSQPAPSRPQSFGFCVLWPSQLPVPEVGSPSPSPQPCVPSAVVGQKPWRGRGTEEACLSLRSPPAVVLASPGCTASSAALVASAFSPRYGWTRIPPVLSGLFGLQLCPGCLPCLDSRRSSPTVRVRQGTLETLRQSGAWASPGFREKSELNLVDCLPCREFTAPESRQGKEAAEVGHEKSFRLEIGSCRFVICQMHVMMPHLPVSWVDVRCR